METIAVVLKQPEQVELNRLALTAPTADDVVVDVDWSGISTGTERLLWSGRMPPFPGMGYPLVPGYESVGRVVEAGSSSGLHPGERVFVPGANASARCAACSAARPRGWWCRRSAWCRSISSSASAASCWRWRRPPITPSPRKARRRRTDRRSRRARAAAGAHLDRAFGNEPPTVWESNPARAGGAVGYGVIDPEHDTRRDYEHLRRQRRCRPARYADRPPRAGRRDRARRILQRARCRLPFRRPSCARRACASPPNGSQPILPRPGALIEAGRLSLDGLITHRARRERRAGRLSHRLRRSRLPENGPGLESAAHECRAVKSA